MQMLFYELNRTGVVVKVGMSQLLRAFILFTVCGTKDCPRLALFLFLVLFFIASNRRATWGACMSQCKAGLLSLLSRLRTNGVRAIF